MAPATLLVAVLAVLAAGGGVAEAAAPGGSGTQWNTSTAGGSSTPPPTSSSYPDEVQQETGNAAKNQDQPVKIHSISLEPGRVNQLEIHSGGRTLDIINISDSGHLILPNASCDGATLRKVKEEQAFRIADYVLAVFALVSASLNAWLISQRPAAPQQANPPPQRANPPQQQQQANPPQQASQANNTNNMFIVFNR